MPIIAIQSEKTIEQLIEECYGELPAVQLDTIKAAMLAANPHLGVAETLQPGMMIVVPPLSVAAPVSGSAIKAISAALSDYQEKLEQKIESRQAELDLTTNTLGSASFQRATKPISEARELIQSVEAATKSDQIELVETRGLIKEIDVLKSKLDGLSGKLPPFPRSVV